MCTSVAARFPSAECFVVPPSTTAPAGTTTRPKSGSRSTPPDLEGYRRAADLLNFANTDVVCLQQDHLLRMTDETGILQHATHAFPNIVEGYCTDDNARALLLTVYLDEVGQTGPELDRLGDAVRRLPPGRLYPGGEAVPQLPGVRPPLAGGGLVGRLARPRALGAGHLRGAVAAA